MYSIFVTLFLIGVLMITAGFIGRAGTEGIAEVDANVASAFGLMFTYSFIFVRFSSFSELVPIFESICGGIPYLDEIADYGSLENVLKADPVSAATSFMDTVLLSAMIDILNLLPWSQGSAARKSMFMVRIFTGIVIAMISLILLNYVVKSSPVYVGIASMIGSVISLISVGTIPLAVISLFGESTAVGLFAGALLAFATSKPVGILRDSFLKAIVYVLGIYLLEKYFGSIAAGVSQIALIVTIFGPVVIMLIGIALIIRSAFH